MEICGLTGSSARSARARPSSVQVPLCFKVRGLLRRSARDWPERARAAGWLLSWDNGGECGLPNARMHVVYHERVKCRREGSHGTQSRVCIPPGRRRSSLRRLWW